MKPKALLARKVFARTLMSVALVAAYSSASALDLPQFTWNPTGAGLTGSTFTADNIIVSDFATVTFTSGTTFHEFLAAMRALYRLLEEANEGSR